VCVPIFESCHTTGHMCAARCSYHIWLRRVVLSRFFCRAIVSLKNALSRRASAVQSADDFNEL
jgi:hypothetical protein